MKKFLKSNEEIAEMSNDKYEQYCLKLAAIFFSTAIVILLIATYYVHFERTYLLFFCYILLIIVILSGIGHIASFIKKSEKNKENKISNNNFDQNTLTNIQNVVYKKTPALKTMEFSLEGIEYERFEEWRKKMSKKYKDKEAFPKPQGFYTFSFTPTGIGNSIVIKRSTGEEIDVTDVDSW